jgi:hypothetical protein
VRAAGSVERSVIDDKLVISHGVAHGMGDISGVGVGVVRVCVDDEVGVGVGVGGEVGDEARVVDVLVNSAVSAGIGLGSHVDEDVMEELSNIIGEIIGVLGNHELTGGLVDNELLGIVAEYRSLLGVESGTVTGAAVNAPADERVLTLVANEHCEATQTHEDGEHLRPERHLVSVLHVPLSGVEVINKGLDHCHVGVVEYTRIMGAIFAKDLLNCVDVAGDAINDIESIFS